MLSAERIARALSGIPLVRQIEYLPSVGSTNDLAKQLGALGAPEATLVVADEQTAGRGRLGRAWWTPPGSALALSLLLRPQFHPTLAHRLTMLAGLAAAEAIEHVTGLHVGLKWPNYIVIEKSSSVVGLSSSILKLGGILTETSISGQDMEFAVIGLGLNVNVDFGGWDDLPEATSLMNELGRKADRLDILGAWIERWAARYLTLDHDDQLRADWSARLVTLGREVVARNGGNSITGWAEGVSESGALLIRQADGTLASVEAADVTLRANSPDRCNP